MVLSSELLHLDITSDDFGPGFYNTNNACTTDVTVEMNPTSTEELKETKLSLMYVFCVFEFTISYESTKYFTQVRIETKSSSYEGRKGGRRKDLST